MGETAGGINLAEQFQGMSESAKAFLSNTTQAASGLEQSMGAVDSVFKQSAGQIHEWGSNSSESVGMSERAFNEAATSIGGLLNNLGFDMEQSTAKTGELTARAADMAAMFGGDASEAIEAIGSALRGESDPIERYGVMLNEATVNARAMADTGKATADSLTMQEQAAARLAIIMEQTADAQGTFAREADTVAGSQQRMTAAMEDAQATIGGALAPVVAGAADVLTNLVGVFQELPGPIQFTISVMVTLVAAASAIAPAVTAAATAMGAMGVSASSMIGGIRAAGAFLAGPWGVAIGGATAAVGLFAMSQQKALTDIDKFTFAIDAQTGKLAKDGISTFQKFWDELKGGPNGETDISEAAKNVGLSFKDIVGYLNENEDATRRVNRAIQENIDKGGIHQAQAMDLRGALEALNVQLTEEQQAQLEAAAATEEGGGAQAAAAEATKDHNQALTDLHNAIMAYADASLGYRNAAADEIEAHEEATEAVNKHGAESAEGAQAVRDWESSILSAVNAAAEYNASLYTGTDETVKNRMAVEGANAEILRLAQLYGEDAPAALRQLVAGLDGATLSAIGATVSVNEAGQAVINLPNGKTMTVDANDLASQKIRNIQSWLNGLKDKSITITTYQEFANRQNNYPGNPVTGARAHGGITGAADMWGAASGGVRHGGTLINEADGAGELVELPNGSNVMTAGATQAYMDKWRDAAGGGGTNITFDFSSVPANWFGQLMQEAVNKGYGRFKVNNSGRVVVA